MWSMELKEREESLTGVAERVGKSFRVRKVEKNGAYKDDDIY